MYKPKKPSTTSLTINTSKEGETIEKKVNRLINNKEPIKDQAPLNYTERKDGVNPDFDIRADKWDRALDAFDEINKSKLASRTIGDKAKEGMDKEKQTQTKETTPTTTETKSPEASQ